MLVLTRKVHEQIMIGSDVIVTIVRLHGNAARIGIEAPRHVRVVRGELPRDAPADPGANTVVVAHGAA
jgi:carbon storage regulator CsrA